VYLESVMNNDLLLALISAIPADPLKLLRAKRLSLLAESEEFIN
jgi:hypothetical protein